MGLGVGVCGGDGGVIDAGRGVRQGCAARGGGFDAARGQLVEAWASKAGEGDQFRLLDFPIPGY